MGLDRGVLANLDRRLLAELDREEQFQMVRVPVSPAKWPAGVETILRGLPGFRWVEPSRR